MDNVFGHLDGLTGIADDTFIHGKSEILEDHHALNTSNLTEVQSFMGVINYLTDSQQR